MKEFKGKAIYNPSGKAGEYSYWACNFYNGCSNDCTYCYCKRGVMSSNWCNPPKLKSKFKDENHALEIFEKELVQNLHELKEHGLFFSFTTDPMLMETRELTYRAIGVAIKNKVPVKILTKVADFTSALLQSIYPDLIETWKPYVAFGFTLTGHDELEPNASTNAERIEAMKKLHDAGFKTFASIEPIIDFKSSYKIFQMTANSKICDLYKIGLESGKKYNKEELDYFIRDVIWFTNPRNGHNIKIYFKDSLLQVAGINRSDLPNSCVGRDYNIFKN